MAKKIVIANWKLNPASYKEAQKLFVGCAKFVSNTKKTEVVICPPIVYLEKLKKYSKKIVLGAQDVSFEEIGPHTGEIGAEMIYDLGVRYVLVGHSERRARGEKNEEVNKKLKKALGEGLAPILCVGEKERDTSHEYFNLVKNQILECLNGISKNSISKIIIAYEPIWSISTTSNRRDANGDDFYEMNVFIRKVLADKFGVKTKMPRIIYGGSVNDKNAYEFLKEKISDGVLVGGASLKVEKFKKVIEEAESLS